MKYFLSLLLVLALLSANGQHQVADTIRTGDTIPLQRLAGIWVTDDTARMKIEFRYDGKELKLVTGDHRNYDFSIRDAVCVNPLNGVLIKWPPDDCLVRMISNSLIEIAYTPFGGTPARVRYKRLYLYEE
jgi:hypothetical protein